MKGLKWLILLGILLVGASSSLFSCRQRSVDDQFLISFRAAVHSTSAVERYNHCQRLSLIPQSVAAKSRVQKMLNDIIDNADRDLFIRAATAVFFMNTSDFNDTFFRSVDDVGSFTNFPDAREAVASLLSHTAQFKQMGRSESAYLLKILFDETSSISIKKQIIAAIGHLELDEPQVMQAFRYCLSHGNNTLRRIATEALEAHHGKLDTLPFEPHPEP